MNGKANYPWLTTTTRGVSSPIHFELDLSASQVELFDFIYTLQYTMNKDAEVYRVSISS